MSRLSKLGKLLVVTNNVVSPDDFNKIIDTFGNENMKSIIPEIFSGEYISLLNIIIDHSTINSEYSFSRKIYSQFGINIRITEKITTLIDFAVEVKQVDLVKFTIMKGARITTHTLNLLLLSSSIDIAMIIFENVALDLIDERFILILLENHKFDWLIYLQLRGINFNDYSDFIKIISYDYKVAEYLLYAGFNINNENIEISISVDDDRLINLLRSFNANISFEPLILVQMGDSNFFYEEFWGTVFKLENGDYSCVGTTSDGNTIESLTNFGRNIAHRYNIPIYDIYLENLIYYRFSK